MYSSYEDNDAAKSAPVPARAPVAEPSKSTEQNAVPRPNDHANEDENMNQDVDEDDDDDDVDFNLGGGSNSAIAVPQHDMDESTPPYGNVHKASAKDDG